MHIERCTFNGAATSRSRISEYLLPRELARLEPSMGPRLLGRGYPFITEFYYPNIDGPSMGPRLLGRGYMTPITVPNWTDVLQWGRDF